MEQLEDLLERRVGEALASLGFRAPRVDIRPAGRPEFGDYSTAVCLSLAKAARQNPLVLAERLREALRSPAIPGITAVTVSRPGFVNFAIDPTSLAAALLPTILHAGHRYGEQGAEARRPGKIVIEHTNINSNKAAHIGHLRNACIGDTLARLLRATGWQVEVQNYIDDTGAQVADVVVAFHVFQPLEDETQPFDYFCSSLYAAINRRYAEQPDLLERRKQVLREIEEGDNETARFAKALSLRIVRAHLATMARLGVTYDVLTWESDILALGFWQHAFRQLRDRGLLVHPDSGPLAGCWVVPFAEGEAESPIESGAAADRNGDGDGTGRTADKVLVKSDGVATYTAKDIAYQLWKFGLLGLDFSYRYWGLQHDGRPLWTTSAADPTTGDPTTADGEAACVPSFGHGSEVINVIDVRQSYLQQVVKESLRRLGFVEQSDASIHLAYEVVTLSAASARDLGLDVSEARSTYSMSGRQGIEIKADDLISMVQTKLAAKTKEPATAAALAAGAVRYSMLRFNLNQMIVFDVEDALKATGETGVYVQYAYVRAGSILRKVGEQVDLDASHVEVPDALHPAEHALLLRLSEYPRVLRFAAEKRLPSTVAQFAFGVATQFNDFFEHTPPIVREEDPLVRQFRTTVVAATRQVLGNALGILGIPKPDAI